MGIVSSALGPLFSVIILVLIFLAFRAVVLWYWRINESIHLLEWQKNLLNKNTEQNDRIISLLEKLAGEVSPDSKVDATPQQGSTISDFDPKEGF